MEELLTRIEELKKDNKIKIFVEKRLMEFSEMEKREAGDIFKELCFCILTANFSAEKSIKIQEKIGDGFLNLSESQLAERLKELGHRYPNARARYIVLARKYRDSLKKIIKSFHEEIELREWLVKNIKGIGYKEASHFLRNIGYFNFAILDFHIIDFLVNYQLIDKPKILTKRKYLEIEKLLKQVAKKAGISLAELDLYLWYSETGKILK
ncbi:N-glycosylase/DNA lyase [Candidatus Bathyarchaeota archaeon]|nr:N-glycosylase/DNA lyase [Candidatus Bathyarchaeota archaeon]MBS7627343.1 N-glycosylase/DNA lyase [Candidatus Bathyarchaeota archaeon]